MTNRLDLARLPGFASLSPRAQSLVADIAARAPEIAALDGQPGLSTRDLQRLAPDAADSAYREEALSFVTANLKAIAPALQPPRGATTTARAPVTSVENELSRLSVREKAQLVVMEYGDWNHPPKSGGIIVSSPHLTSLTAPQLARLVDSEEGKRGMPLLVAADQEGGRVNRLHKLPGFQDATFASPGDMQNMTAEQIRDEGRQTGRGLAAAKVNVLLGPVLDVAESGTLMANQGRAFGSDPAAVTERAQAYVDGLHEANPHVAVVAKHFPGYNVRGNSDNTPVVDHSSAADLTRRMQPFLTVDGLDGVMLSSITYEALDSQPACFSKKIVDRLREKHPDAVVMTDDLYARGLMSDDVRAYARHRELKSKANLSAAERGDLDRLMRAYPQLGDEAYRRQMSDKLKGQLMDNAERAFLAGADLLLIMDAATARLIHQRIEELATSSPEHARALDQKVRRLLELRTRLRTPPRASPGNV